MGSQPDKIGVDNGLSGLSEWAVEMIILGWIMGSRGRDNGL